MPYGKYDKDALKILFLTNGTASHVWRIDGVARRAEEFTKHEIAVTNSDQWNNDTIGADIVIWEMVSGSHVIDTCHNLGAKVIYEADDAVIDTYGKERKNLMHIDAHHRSSSIETIRKCDAVTVTSPELKENYARFTDKPIFVLPIYMDYDYYKPALTVDMPARNTDEIRLGWFGGKGHIEDLHMVIPALKRVLEKDPRVKFIYCGYGGMESDNVTMRATWGEDIFKTLPRERRELVPGVEEHFWPTKHRFLDLDIGIAPLIEDDFNRHKVHTKWLEYSALETPSVVSPTVYSKVVEHGKTGLIAKTEDEWFNHIMALVNDIHLRRKIGLSAAEEVKSKHNIDDYWMEWIRVYQDIMAL